MFRVYLILAFLLASMLPLKVAAETNVILILIDDLGMEAISCYGGESYATPQFDQLAREGMMFKQCYSLPLCAPTRVKIMTGKYNVRNYTRWGWLPDGEITFANILQNEGYATCIAGKWQLSFDATDDPFQRPFQFGFDEYCLFNAGDKTNENRYKNPVLIKNGDPLKTSTEDYGPDVVNEFILDFIERKKDEPFLVYYPMMLTHYPFQPTPDTEGYDDFHDYAVNDPVYFADMVQYMDKLLGRLMGKLGELNLRENTVVLIVGDNGTPTQVTSIFNGEEYRGGKGYARKDGTHVPFIANWKGSIPAGQTNNNLVDLSDFFTTIADIAGVSYPDDLDGQSFYKQLIGEPYISRDFVFGYYGGKASYPKHIYVHDKEYKLNILGEFFDTDIDPAEKDPLEVAELSNEEKQIRDQFQGIFRDIFSTPQFVWENSDLSNVNSATHGSYITGEMLTENGVEDILKIHFDPDIASSDPEKAPGNWMNIKDPVDETAGRFISSGMFVVTYKTEQYYNIKVRFKNLDDEKWEALIAFPPTGGEYRNLAMNLALFKHSGSEDGDPPGFPQNFKQFVLIINAEDQHSYGQFLKGDIYVKGIKGGASLMNANVLVELIDSRNLNEINFRLAPHVGGLNADDIFLLKNGSDPVPDIQLTEITTNPYNPYYKIKAELSSETNYLAAIKGNEVYYFQNVVEFTTGVLSSSGIENDNEVKILPHPHGITLQANTNLQKVWVCDILGRAVIAILDINSDHCQINLPEPGLYITTILLRDKKVSLKHVYSY